MKPGEKDLVSALDQNHYQIEVGPRIHSDKQEVHSRASFLSGPICGVNGIDDIVDICP